MDYLGEVLESSTLKFTAQARELDKAPDFGSLIRVENGACDIFAIVFSANTGSSELNRRPGAYGLNREQLAENQPQIFELLKTDFSGLIIGHAVGDKYFGYLPPRPALLHSFVYPCSAQEVRSVAQSANFLYNLCSPAFDSGDELLAAALRTAAKYFDSPRAYLVQAGRELLRILRDDYDRFRSVISRIEMGELE